MKPSIEREQRLFDALKRITKYQPPDRIRGRYASSLGLSDEEAIEYAYDNVLEEAKRAIKGVRRPTGSTGNAGVGARPMTQREDAVLRRAALRGAKVVAAGVPVASSASDGGSNLKPIKDMNERELREELQRQRDRFGSENGGSVASEARLHRAVRALAGQTGTPPEQIVDWLCDGGMAQMALSHFAAPDATDTARLAWVAQAWCGGRSHAAPSPARCPEHHSHPGGVAGCQECEREYPDGVNRLHGSASEGGNSDA